MAGVIAERAPLGDCIVNPVRYATITAGDCILGDPSGRGAQKIAEATIKLLGFPRASFEFLLFRKRAHRLDLARTGSKQQKLDVKVSKIDSDSCGSIDAPGYRSDKRVKVRPEKSERSRSSEDESRDRGTSGPLCGSRR